MKAFLLAEFDSEEQATDAARIAADAGRAAQDVLSHKPVEGITQYLRPPSRGPIGWVMFVAASVGASIGWLMQWYSAVFDYPTNSGGRPFNSWPAFLLVPYELAILSAGIVGLLGWMWMCGLPKLYHPLFSAPITARAVEDRYLLVFPADAALARWVKDHLKPRALHVTE
jgi:hypothetical protein